MTSAIMRGFDWRYLPIVLLLALVAACAQARVWITQPRGTV